MARIVPAKYLVGITNVNNTLIGVGSIRAGGIFNTFVGVNAGLVNTGSANTFIGYYTGQANTSGTYNIFIGRVAGFNNQTGVENVFIGDETGFHNISGNQNVFIGDSTGQGNITDENTFVGAKAGYTNTTGSGNVFVGFKTGFLNQSGNNNTFIGNNAGYNNRANGNTFVGFDAGFNNVSGTSNVFIGNLAGINTSGSVGNGSFNTFVGNSAGTNNIGDDNTFIGDDAGYYNTSGNKNTFVGSEAGTHNVVGSGNVFVGYGAGNQNYNGANNTAIGWEAGLTNKSGKGNVFLGWAAGSFETGSNKLYIANTPTQTPLIGGDFSTPGVTINGPTTPNSTFNVAGSQSRAITYVITSTTLGITQFHVMAATISGNITITLPDATIISGRTYYIQKAVAENSVVLATTSGQFINNDLSTSINSQWETLRVISNGFDWISQNFGNIGTPGQLKPNITRYTMPGWIVNSANDHTALTSAKTYYIPFFVSTTTTFTEYVIHLFQQGSAGNLAKLGIYTWNDGVPGALILSAGTVTTDIVGVRTIAINLTLNRGFYFFAVKNNNIPVAPIYDCIDIPFSAPVTGMSTTTGTATTSVVLTVASVFTDPYPDLATAPTAMVNTFPIILLREN